MGDEKEELERRSAESWREFRGTWKKRKKEWVTEEAGLGFRKESGEMKRRK